MSAGGMASNVLVRSANAEIYLLQIIRRNWNCLGGYGKISYLCKLISFHCNK